MNEVVQHRYRAMSKAYPSNLTQAQFELLEPFIPPAKLGGRPREVEIWEVLNAIFYVLCEGCRWRSLPGDFPGWKTVYTYFRNWRTDGTWVRIHDRLRDWVRVDNEPEASPFRCDHRQSKCKKRSHGQPGGRV